MQTAIRGTSLKRERERERSCTFHFATNTNCEFVGSASFDTILLNSRVKHNPWQLQELSLETNIRKEMTQTMALNSFCEKIHQLGDASKPIAKMIATNEVTAVCHVQYSYLRLITCTRQSMWSESNVTLAQSTCDRVYIKYVHHDRTKSRKHIHNTEVSHGTNTNIKILPMFYIYKYVRFQVPLALLHCTTSATDQRHSVLS